MRRIIRAAVALPLLCGPALAQNTTTSSGAGALAPSTGGVADPGGLALGGGTASGIATAGSPAATTGGGIANPGGLSVGRTNGTGGAPSGTGAGISTGATGVPQSDDTYLYPLYGKSFR